MDDGGFNLRVPIKVVSGMSVGLTITDVIHSELSSIPETSASGEQDVRSYYVDADWKRRTGGTVSLFGISGGVFNSEVTRASMRTPTIRLECDVSSGKPIMRGSGQGFKRFNERATGGRMPHVGSGGTST